MTVFLETSTSELEARLVRKIKDVNSNGYTLIRSWPYIDATTADTLVLTMDAVATYTNPKADQQEYAGTFVNSRVEAIEGDPDTDDRAVEIRQTLIRVESPGDTSDLAGLEPIITQENELLQLFGLPEADSDSTTGEEDTITYVFKNINPANRATMMAFTDANLESSLPGAAWRYVDRVFKEEEDNTATFAVIFKKMTWAAFDETSPDLTWYTNKTTPHERIIEMWFKVNNDDALSNLYQVENPSGDIKYNAMRVDITERRDGAVNVRREYWREAKGASAGDIEEVDQELIEPFALVSGTMDRITVVNHNLLAKGDAFLTGANISGYTQTQPLREEFNKSTGLYDVYRVYEKVTWTAWSTNPAASETEYFNIGTDSGATQGSEQDGILKTWHGIQKADLSTAMGELRDGTGHVGEESGYIITGTSVRDNKNGSLTFTQTQHKRIDNVDVDEEQHTNPLGFTKHDGKLEFIRTVYKDFSKTALDTAVSGESAPAGYALVRNPEDIQADGIWQRVYTYIKATWSNTAGSSPDKTLDTRIVYGWRNYDPQNGTDGFDVKKIDGGDGIPNGDAVEILGNEAPEDANHVIDSLVLTERANGEVSIRKQQTKSREITGAIDESFQADSGRQQERERVLFLNLIPADATLVYNDAVTNKADMTGSSYEAPGAGHVLGFVKRIPQPNGLVAIMRSTFIPKGWISQRYAAGTQDPYRIYCASFPDEFGTPMRKIVTEARLITTTEATARTFAKASSLHPVWGWRMGSVRWIDGYSAYEAMRVTVQDWVAGGSYNFDDAG